MSRFRSGKRELLLKVTDEEYEIVLRKCLEELPFDIIVYHLLPFFQHFIKGREKTKDTSCFGYFRNDPRRKPYFLFPYLVSDGRILLRNHKKWTIVDFSKLQHLSLDQRTRITHKVMGNLIIHSDKFASLRILNLDTIFDDFLPNLFSNKRCFPSLKKMRIQLFEKRSTNVREKNTRKIFQKSKVKVNLREWSKAEHVWSNLTDFHLSSSLSDFYNQTNRIEKRFAELEMEKEKGIGNLLKNIENLRLQSICFSERQTFFLPKIKQLELDGISAKHIDFETGPSFKKVIFRTHEEDVREFNNFLSRTVSLESILICSNNYSHNWFNGLEEGIKRLRNVHLSQCAFEKNFQFGENIEEIKLSRVHPSRSENLLCHEYPNLKSLEWTILNWSRDYGYYDTSLQLDDPRSISLFAGSRCASYLCKTLKMMVLLEGKDGGSMQKCCFCDEMFQEHQWVNLETLIIENCEGFTGESYKDFPKLKKLHVWYSNNVTDSLFKDTKFECLEELDLYRSFSLKGEGWDTGLCNRLKILVVSNCNINSSQFFLNTFKNLEELAVCVISSDTVVEYRKGTFPKLRELQYTFCTNVFDDRLFQDEEMCRNLRKLNVYNCSGFHGENWAEMENLEHAMVEKMNVGE